MDTSIRPVTPQIMRQRGADAFDRGQGIKDHNMNPGTPAIADWQAGWLERQAKVTGTVTATFYSIAMGMTPP